MKNFKNSDLDKNSSIWDFPEIQQKLTKIKNKELDKCVLGQKECREGNNIFKKLK